MSRWPATALYFLDKSSVRGQIAPSETSEGRATILACGHHRGVGSGPPGRVLPQQPQALKETQMETAIGVFASRDRAEEAARELLTHDVPESSIVFLTRSENEAKTVAQELGAFVGGVAGGTVGMTAGVTAATLLVPGIGAVFALGFGAATLLGLVGAGTGAALGKAVTREAASAQLTSDEQCPDDVSFFREVLKAGRSLIVVRTDSHEIAHTACRFLDRLGLGMQGRIPTKMQTATRETNGVTIIDVSGRITLG